MIDIKGLFAGLVVAAFSVQVAVAQDFPSRPITLVTAFPPGSASDNTARFVGRMLQARLKQSVIVENRPGAFGMIGAAQVAKAPPDGYTLLQSSHGYTRTFFKSMPLDFSKELTPVTMTNEGVFFVYVAASSPIKSISELLAQAKV